MFRLVSAIRCAFELLKNFWEHCHLLAHFSVITTKIWTYEGSSHNIVPISQKLLNIFLKSLFYEKIKNRIAGLPSL